jgi:hypothetical protein
MMVWILGLSLGPDDLDRQVSMVARNAIDENEIQDLRRIVGNAEVKIGTCRPVGNDKSALVSNRPVTTSAFIVTYVVKLPTSRLRGLIPLKFEYPKRIALS